MKRPAKLIAERRRQSERQQNIEKRMIDLICKLGDAHCQAFELIMRRWAADVAAGRIRLRGRSGSN